MLPPPCDELTTSEPFRNAPRVRPPGLMLVFLKFGSRLSVQISWVDDCVSPAEAENLERDVRRALLEEEA